MAFGDNAKRRDSGRIVLDPPAFSPPPEMRKGYLGRRRDELDMLLVSGRGGEWKPVMTVASHVRGTGAMYGFANIGDAAENLAKAVQNGAANSLEFLEQYAKTVNESYV